MLQKECTKCKQIKPVGAFSPNPRMKSGYASWCRECVNRKIRENYRGKKEKGERWKSCETEAQAYERNHRNYRERRGRLCKACADPARPLSVYREEPYHEECRPEGYWKVEPTSISGFASNGRLATA